MASRDDFWENHTLADLAECEDIDDLAISDDELLDDDVEEFLCEICAKRLAVLSDNCRKKDDDDTESS